MNEANAFWFVTGSFSGLSLGAVCAFLILYGRKKLEKLEAADVAERTPINQINTRGYAEALIEARAVDQPDGVAPIAEDFAVTGKPLKPSWRIRKRELEAASRTKRKQLESFRGID